MRLVRTVSVPHIQTRRLLHVAHVAIVVIAAFAALAFAAAPAHAQDAEKARQLFQQGSKYYDLGQFDKAIEAWQQGYDQKPDPGFLYNIAQAHRQKQDAAKAIFFYKGYLRNSPKAHNRAEVDKKIAELQKQLDAGTPPPANTTTPPGNGTAPPPANGTTQPVNGMLPPPTVTMTDGTQPPLNSTPPPTTFTDAPPTAVAVIPPPSPPVRNLPFDATAGIGPGFWASGVNGTAKPSFVLTLAGGYTFGPATQRFRFRMGGLFGYTFLAANEDSTNVTFLSFLLDPSLDVRLTQSGQWHLMVDIGLGIQMLTGLKTGSKLLAANEQLSVNGAQGMFETRFGVGVVYRLLPELSVFSSIARMNSEKKQHFHANITRDEWLFGAAYRF
jgi:hypothetical protein